MSLVVAAPHGRSGKTTLAMGLCAAWRRRGLTVQPFKKGPDFIDPGWLSLAAGRPCRNLDLFLLGEDALRAVFRRGMAGAEVAVVEGAMGLFDGVDADGSGSTAQVARVLGLPVLLLLDVTRMTRTAAAVVKGMMTFEPGVRILGVVLNRVGSKRQETLIRAAMERYTGLPVLGAIPRLEAVAVPDRHLGLIPVHERVVGERLLAEEVVARAGDMVDKYIDLDALFELLRNDRAAYPLPPEEPFVDQVFGERTDGAAGGHEDGAVPVGVLRDRVFSFYYLENLEALQAAGARLVFIDSLHAPALPPVAGLYAGGGFPEIFAAELEANRSLRASILAAVGRGLPVYAECGGLMYLAEGLEWQGRVYEMVGALPLQVSMEKAPQGHGYVEAEVVAQNAYFPVGAVLRGHEFHHSRPRFSERANGLARGEGLVLRLRRGMGFGDGRDGLRWGSVFASYTHIHALTCPGWATALVRKARAYVRTLGEAVACR